MDAKLQEAPADTAAQAMRECDRLRDENAKLRRELCFYKSQVEGVEEERLRLRKKWMEAKAENAKLWEYITWLEEWTLDGALMYRDVRFMMDMKRKELGIKVSE